jgi:hypothetical protein
MTARPDVVDSETGAGKPGERAYGFVRETCEALIASGRLRPEFTDPDQLAQIAWASLHGLLALHIVKQEHDRIRCATQKRPPTT